MLFVVTVSYETEPSTSVTPPGSVADGGEIALMKMNADKQQQHKLSSAMQAHEHFLYDTVQDDIFIGREGKVASHIAVMRSRTTDNFSSRGRTLGVLSHHAVHVDNFAVSGSDSGFQSQGAMARCVEEKISDSGSSSHLSASSSSVGSKMSESSTGDDVPPPLPAKSSFLH